MKNILLGSICCLFISCLYITSASAEAPELSASCTACHGENGISSNPHWPNLAGQQVGYLVKEMKAFRDGTRVDAIMAAGLLQGFSDQQIEELARYFSKLEKVTPTKAEDTSAGQHVRASCVSCHGMDGYTVSPLWANLAGQKEAYLKKQLMDYKTGQRQHPIMQVIANELSDQQIADVAKYYSQN